MSANIVSVDDEPLRKDIKNLLRIPSRRRSTRWLTRGRPSSSGPSATRGRRVGRPTAAATTRGGSSRAPGKSSSAYRSSAARPSGRPSSSTTADARPRSRRPSSRFDSVHRPYISHVFRCTVSSSSLPGDFAKAPAWKTIKRGRASAHWARTF